MCIRSYTPKQTNHSTTASLLRKLVLRDTLAHSARRAHTAADHLEQLISVVGARPLLVRDDLDALLHLRLLHDLAVRAHAALRVRARERVADQRRAVQACERDELPAVAHGREALDV